MSERQTATTLDEIRPDHVARYQWVTDYLISRAEPLRAIADAACGCGYGTFMLAKAFPEARVHGLDISNAAIEFAREHWHRTNAHYDRFDVTAMNFSGYMDAIVSFETLEHVEQSAALLQSAYRSMKGYGVLLVSTPNELVRPFNKSKFPFHVRHFTPDELRRAVEAAGFEFVEFHGQRRYETAVTPGTENAKHIIAVAVKS